jgi:hypothetical protein
MKTNIAFFRGAVAAPVLPTSRASAIKQNRSLPCHRDAELPRLRRPNLFMIWRINAASGRLECRWSLDRSAQAEEGVSRSGLLGRAA